MGGEAEFSVWHVDQDVHIGSQSTELENRTCNLRGVQGGHTHRGPGEQAWTQQCTHCAGRSGPPCARVRACASEGRECGTLLFHMPHRAQRRAQGCSTEASSGCPRGRGRACQPRALHIVSPAALVFMITEGKLAPGHGDGCCQLPPSLGRTTQGPHTD